MNAEPVRKLRGTPWLVVVVALYLTVSALEMARLSMLAESVDADDSGFSRWEAVATDEAPLLVRWSGLESSMRRAIEAPVLTLTAYGAAAANPVALIITIDGERVDSYTIGPGIHTFHYYLPAILSREKWSEAQRRRDERDRYQSHVASAGWPTNWRELRPWRAVERLPQVEITTMLRPAVDRADPAGPAGDPDEGTDQARVGIAAVAWLDELPSSGGGFHAPETGPDGTEVRWTRRWASQPMVAAGRAVTFDLRAVHPDIADQPVRASFFWNSTQATTVDLADTEWRSVTIPVPPGARAGVLTVHVDRTWSPARAGVSPDNRELGVLLGRIRWR